MNINQMRAHPVYWQAHRGGGAFEAPDNTMAANHYTWELGGIPEADVRTTRDGVIVCLHDDTPARTTDVPDAEQDRHISTFTYAETRTWDAGVKFSESFRGERIPSLEEVFKEMQGHPAHMIYLDLKDVNLQQLGLLIDQYKVNEQVIFTHNVQDNCSRMKQIAVGVKTMLWIGGNEQQIMQKFLAARESGFAGLDQVQIHLNSMVATMISETAVTAATTWPYEVKQVFLEQAIAAAAEAGIDLEVFPFQFTATTIASLLEMGIQWFATDEPSRFLQCVQAHQS